MFVVFEVGKTLLSMFSAVLRIKENLSKQEQQKLANDLFTAHVGLKKCYLNGVDLVNKIDQLIKLYEDHQYVVDWDDQKSWHVRCQFDSIKRTFLQQSSMISLCYDLQNNLIEHMDLIKPEFSESIMQFYEGKGTLVDHAKSEFESVMMSLGKNNPPVRFSEDSPEFTAAQGQSGHDFRSETMIALRTYFDRQKLLDELNEFRDNINALGNFISENFKIEALKISNDRIQHG